MNGFVVLKAAFKAELAVMLAITKWSINGVFSASVCGRFFRGFTGIFLAKQPVPEPGGRVVDFERVIPA